MCARFISDQNKVLFQYESGTYATASGTGQWIGQVQSHDLGEEENIQLTRYLGAGDRNVDVYNNGPRDVNGTFTYFPQDWKFLAFALGSNVDAGSPSPFTHTMSEANSDQGNSATSGPLNPFVSFTIEDSKTAPGTGLNFIRTANGCIVNTFTVSAGQGDIITVDVSYMAQSVSFTSGASTAVTAATTRAFLWSDTHLSLPSGTTQSEMKSFELIINNNLEPAHYVNGSRVTAVPIPTNRDHTFNFTADASSERAKELYDQYFKGGSTLQGVLVIDAGAATRDAIITFSGGQITAAEIPSPNEGVNEYSFTLVPQVVSVLVNDAIQLYNIF